MKVTAGPGSSEDIYRRTFPGNQVPQRVWADREAQRQKDEEKRSGNVIGSRSSNLGSLQGGPPGSGSTDQGKGRQGEQKTLRARSSINNLLNDEPAETSGDKGKGKGRQGEQEIPPGHRSSNLGSLQGGPPGSGSTDKGKGRQGEQNTLRARSSIHKLLNDESAEVSGDKGKAKEKREKSKSDSPKGDDGKDRKGKRPRRD